MRPTLLAVDLSNQLYKAAAVNPNLSFRGQYTGGIYGLIAGIQKAIKVCGATSIVLCRDTKPYLRSLLYPKYKALRENNKDEDLVKRVKDTLPLMYDLAEVLRWPVWSVDGFESDDLVAHCVTQHRHRYESIVAMSNDSDLYQLFQWPVFSIYKGGKTGIYSHRDFQEEWNVAAGLMPLILSLSGTHNEVEGIAKIGPINARRIALDPAALRQTRQLHAAVVDRNLELITLPHREFPKETPIPKPGIFNERDLLRFCGKLDINIHQSACEAFAQVGKK